MDEALLEWLYTREVMRQLGFSSDDLYIIVNRTGPTITLILLLQTQGLEFRVCTGTTTIPYDRFQQVFEDICAKWNSGEMEDVVNCFETSKAAQEKVFLVKALLDKGFHIPRIN